MISTATKRDKAEQTTAAAWEIIDSEAAAREAKTARLRKLREAKEAEEAAAVAKEPAPGKKPRRKAK